MRRAFALVLVSAATSAAAEVSDVTITDVTTRAFSVVWASSEPISSDPDPLTDETTTVRVFTDVNGTNEITSLDIRLVSANVPTAHDQGIVKVDVRGLAKGSTVYVQTTTVGASGTVVFPAVGSLLELRIAEKTSKSDGDGNPIINDVIFHEILDPAGAAPADGSLLLVKVPSLSKYPLSAFVADGFDSPVAAVDLNNVFDDDAADGSESAQVAGGAVLEISEFRGLLCANQGQQKLTRLRRAPPQDENKPITELKAAGECFAPDGIAADFNCDGRVGPSDFNEFLIRFGLETSASAPDCRFHSDFDLIPDGRIDPSDFNEFLISFGRSE